MLLTCKPVNIYYVVIISKDANIEGTDFDHGFWRIFKSFADTTNIFDLKVIVNTLLREKLFSYYYIVYCEPPSYFQRLLSEFSYFYMKLMTRKEETSFVKIGAQLYGKCIK